MIARIRAAIHDKDELEYTDDNIVDVINSALRYVRRVIKVYRPKMLAEPLLSGTLAAGQKNISLPTIPTKMLDVRVDGKRIEALHLELIDDAEAQGQPVGFYLLGMQALYFYPTPDRATAYQILYVGDFVELGIEDVSPLPNEFDDLLIEYAVIRLSMGNEFDMSQETQVMMGVQDQIVLNLRGVEEVDNAVSGYYDPLPDNGFVRGAWS